MKTLIRLYHFLGSLYFAVSLIALTAVFVIAGTFIEAKTDSHLFAASIIYSHPFFGALLGGFFINILFSTLRRWPFKTRHIPFIITHLGLLMLISGTFVKNFFGIQGNMMLTEGTGSHHLLLPNTYAIHLEKNPFSKGLVHEVLQYEISPSKKGNLNRSQSPIFANLKVRLKRYFPHVETYLESWIKENYGIIMGSVPFPVFDWSDNEASAEAELPVSSKVTIGSQRWDLMAFRTNQVFKLARKVYLDKLQVQLRDLLSENLILEGKLTDFLNQNMNVKEEKLSFDFNWGQDLQDDSQPSLTLSIGKKKLFVALNGPDALINQNLSTPYLGSLPISVDLENSPQLLLIQDQNRDLHLFAFAQNGQIYEEIFPSDQLRSLIALDRGYGGYFVQCKLPFTLFFGRKECELADLHMLLDKLRENLKFSDFLSPPLEIYRTACNKAGVDFANSFLKFLYHWDKAHAWVYPGHYPLLAELASTFELMEIKEFPSNALKASFWIATLFKNIEKQLLAGDDFLNLLAQRKWPLLKELEQIKKTRKDSHEQTAQLLTSFTQQLYALVTQLPEPSENLFHLSPSKKAELFSAYLRVHEIHLQNILSKPTLKEREERLQNYLTSHPSASAEKLNEIKKTVQEPSLTLETPLTLRFEEKLPGQKLENHTPGLVLEFEEKNRKEWIALAYDKTARGFAWPILNGTYRIRFQPKIKEIPYHIRLRNARQLNYPSTQQPYSFECDILVSNREGQEIEKTISMNHVYETWDGYRFYLANLTPGNENEVQRVQLVINHDPAKYILTYPGALVLSCGILLLFWLTPRRR